MDPKCEILQEGIVEHQRENTSVARKVTRRNAV